jgi:7-cyano-7-deazaguanosine (preQ0) biosynthesis protein QueE
MSSPGKGTNISLKVSRQPNGEPEIFHSLQGEGASIGTPSVFLRLAQCNLTCTWCDTAYTWDWKRYDYEREVVELSLEQVEERVLGYGCRHLVITGGEPLLQQAGLVSLVSSLKRRGFTFEVETNGTIAPHRQLLEDIDQWNVSPKLSTSGNAPHRREIPEALLSFANITSAYFKFVVVEQADLEEVSALVDRYDLPRARVILMPEGQTTAVLQERGRWLSRLCTENGFRFTPRLHILLWGDKRGT